jgi:hypothetical protein
MEPTFKKAVKAQIRCRRQQAPYRQIDIWIILGKIGFEWFSAHAEGFFKAVGRKPNTVKSTFGSFQGNVGFKAKDLGSSGDLVAAA